MRIKFITLNIFNGEFLDKCIDFLKSESPDIFVLQEVYNGAVNSLDKKYRSFDFLKREFSGYFYYYSPAYFRTIKGYRVDVGNAIFSKLKITKKKTTFYYKEYGQRIAETIPNFLLTPRNLQRVVIDVQGKTFNIFNTQGVWGLDGKDNKDCLTMSRKIVDQIKGGKNVILAGDMNVDPKTQTIKNIEKYLNSVFKVGLKSTFNVEIKKKAMKKGLYIWKDNDLKNFTSAVVDMIFVSPDIKVIDHYCPRVDVSDHFPLVAVLEV